MYLSYMGIRVTDLERSLRFYVGHFGLRPPKGTELPKGQPNEQTTVMLVDPRSSQRLELNYYPPGNPYAVPYVAGEGFDHLAFRVDDLEAFLKRLAQDGVHPEHMAHYEGPMMATPSFRVAYVRDPDGNQLELYDSPNMDASKFDPEQY
jgi:catechol 2,3-dioxygenase-like lactoylglutathione lyase family enzyme